MQNAQSRLFALPSLPSPPLALFLVTMCLVTTGIVMVYSASNSESYLIRQMVYAGIGLVGMLFFANLDYTLLRRYSTAAMLTALALLIVVLIVGTEINGSKRWLSVGPLRAQPSELAKIALVIYMAKMLDDRRQYIRSFFSGVLPACIITALFTVMIVLEPDFSAALVLCCTIFGMWLAAEMRWFHLMSLVAAGMPAAVFAFLLEPYRLRRVFAFLTMDKEAISGSGHQLYQSLVSIGSGGMWGRGLGESVQKFYYVPERHTDFIFSILGEELGFVRASLVVFAFAALTMIGWRIALRATDLFGSLLASGIVLMIFINTAINLGVVLGLLPTTGMVLPFISYGGTGLVVYMSAVGILMNIACKEHEHYAARP